jgi:hypothetical protein
MPALTAHLPILSKVPFTRPSLQRRAERERMSARSLWRRPWLARAQPCRERRRAGHEQFFAFLG